MTGAPFDFGQNSGIPSAGVDRFDARVWISEASRRFHDSETHPCRGEPCDDRGYCERHSREDLVVDRYVRMKLARAARVGQRAQARVLVARTLRVANSILADGRKAAA